jgi:hypothetical protein
MLNNQQDGQQEITLQCKISCGANKTLACFKMPQGAQGIQNDDLKPQMKRLIRRPMSQMTG